MPGTGNGLSDSGFSSTVILANGGPFAGRAFYGESGQPESFIPAQMPTIEKYPVDSLLVIPEMGFQQNVQLTSNPVHPNRWEVVV